MLRPIIAGNWKMNTSVHDGAALVMKLRDMVRGIDAVDIVIAPPFTTIYHLSHLVADSPIKLAGQNMHWESSGAYTGEVSASMLMDVGCRYVIIGHSERRQFFGETDERVNKKAFAAIKAGLAPIICVGETLEERDADKTLEKVSSQVAGALDGLSSGMVKDVVVAYEPIWAIGTGRTATARQAEEVHNAIREQLYDLYGTAIKDVRIIYGGSVKPDNIDSLMAEPNIDGALVGGASLKAEDFSRIIKFRAK